MSLKGHFARGKPITLAEGKHKVKYSAAGFEDSQEKTINIVRKKDTNDRFSLTKSAPPPPPPPSSAGGASIVSFSATPSSIQQGSSDQATLQWATKDSVSTSIDPGPGTVPASGQQSVRPTSTTTYTLTTKGKDGQAKTQQAVVTVTPAPVQELRPPSPLSPSAQPRSSRASRPHFNGAQ